MTRFENLEGVILGPPSVIDIFKQIRNRFPTYPHIVALATWNIETLEWCLRERSAPGLMAWESSMRDFLMANLNQEHTVLHRCMMARLNELVFAYNVDAFESLAL